jgi:CubicO group peptidase (beta-lactamase class C family)
VKDFAKVTQLTDNEARLPMFASLDAAVQADIDAGVHFGASLLVARGGKVIHRANLGTVAPNRPARSDDRYLLMSMSKVFTAVLVLRAIEAGRFQLDTRVDDLLPGFGYGGKEKATILQLLNHTAGLPTALVPPPVPLSAIGDLARKMKAMNRLKAVYEPGTRCAYTSGTGYDALGQVLVATDPKRRSFNQIAKEDLFDPLGMRTASFGLRVSHPKRVPVTHTPANENPSSSLIRKALNDWLGEGELPAGGAYAEIDDLFLFTEALIGRSKNGFQLLSPEMLDLARQNHTGNLKLEAIPPLERFAMLRQALASVGIFKAIAAARAAKGGAASQEKFPDYPANFTLLGSYVRGTGDFLTPAGLTASPNALAAMGGASTGWLIDTERDLTFIFLSAGFIEGLAHPRRLSRLADLAIAAIRD